MYEDKTHLNKRKYAFHFLQVKSLPVLLHSDFAVLLVVLQSSIHSQQRVLVVLYYLCLFLSYNVYHSCIQHSIQVLFFSQPLYHMILVTRSSYSITQHRCCFLQHHIKKIFEYIAYSDSSLPND